MLEGPYAGPTITVPLHISQTGRLAPQNEPCTLAPSAPQCPPVPPSALHPCASARLCAGQKGPPQGDCHRSGCSCCTAFVWLHACFGTKDAFMFFLQLTEQAEVFVRFTISPERFSSSLVSALTHSHVHTPAPACACGSALDHTTSPDATQVALGGEEIIFVMLHFDTACFHSDLRTLHVNQYPYSIFESFCDFLSALVKSMRGTLSCKRATVSAGAHYEW